MTVESLKMVSFEDLKKIISNNDLEGLKAAFEVDGFNVNMTDSTGMTALHEAAMFDKVEILEILINHPQIDINAKARCKVTPLMIAAQNGQSRSVKFLLENRADASCCNRDGRTALWYASECEINQNLECFEALLKTKYCCIKQEKWIRELIYNKEIMEFIKRLIIETSDPYYMKTFGDTVIHYGCHVGSLDTVKMIVEKGIVNINSVDDCVRSPLQIALRGSFLEIADYLIQKGAKLDIKDSFGNSAYEYAARHDRSETFLKKYEPEEEFLDGVLEALIMYSRYKTLSVYAQKCTTEKYPNGQSILMRAITCAFEKNYATGMKILLPHNTDKEFITNLAKKTIKAGYCELFELLYSRFLELESSEAKIKKIRSKLFVTALEERKMGIGQFLKVHGADPDEDANDGGTPLFQACYKDDKGLVESVLRLGADVNRPNREGKSALQYACEKNNVKLVQILLKYGADVRCRDSQGFSPLLSAAYRGRSSLFLELFKVDKDLNQRSIDQLTPFLAACSSGTEVIVEELIEAGACQTDVDYKNRNCLHFVSTNYYLCDLLFEKLDKKDFFTMLCAVDADGLRPLDNILKIKNAYKTIIPELWVANPNIIDLIKAPICVKIPNSNEEIMCLICRDDLVKDDCTMVLPCKHLYHEDCYKEWGKRNAVCPYCQRPVNLVKN